MVSKKNGNSSAPGYDRNTGDISHPILNKITDGYFTIDHNSTVIQWPSSAVKVMQTTRKETEGVNFWHVFPETTNTAFFRKFQQSLNDKNASVFREYFEPIGRWLEIIVSPENDKYIVYFRDTTKQYRIQLINQRTEEISGVAGWEYDVVTQEIYMTPKAYELYGLPKNHPIDLETNRKLYTDQSLKKISEALEAAVTDKKPYELELELKSDSGKNRMIRINGFPLIEDDKVKKIYGTLEDITQKIHDLQKYQESIQKLKSAQKIARLGYWTYNFRLDQSEWSEETYKIWEVDPETFQPNFENFLQTVHPDDRHLMMGDLDTFPPEGFIDTEHRIITPKDKIKWVLERITLHRDKDGTPLKLEGIALDITSKKEQEVAMHQAMKEKDTLLSEIHHRVKNNLAVISGMMQLQAFEEESEIVKVKLMDSVLRIVSMASVHEQLYQSSSLSELDFSGNLQNLVRKLVGSMKVEPFIDFEFDISTLQLNVNQALPLSLIINEVVSNIVKYAFEGRKKGHISFHLSEDDDKITLKIKDNGKKVPKNLGKTEKISLGLRLIDILSQQLDAVYNYQSSDYGTVFTIQFLRSDKKGPGSTNI